MVLPMGRFQWPDGTWETSDMAPSSSRSARGNCRFSTRQWIPAITIDDRLKSRCWISMACKYLLARYYSSRWRENGQPPLEIRFLTGAHACAAHNDSKVRFDS